MSPLFNLATLALPLLAHVLPALAAQCSATQKCPASAPCCSEYGFCGSGNYCQQGCEPLHSFSLNSCRPNPICRSGSISFPENLDRLHMNATKYDGNATNYDWVVNSGYAVPMSDGLRLTLNQTNSGTKISSTRYVHYGKIEFVMRTSKWAGVVSAAITMSDVKDEIDWEWTGTATSEAQTNVWFLGIADYSKTLGETVQMGTNTAEEFHKYTIDWQPDTLTWSLDDRVVRTLTRESTLSSDGQRYAYPTTPSRVQVSIWPGGIPASAPGTIEWAGGMIQWNEPEYRSNGYYWNTLKSVSVQCTPDRGQNQGTTGWVYTGNNSQAIPMVGVTNASTLINGASHIYGARVDGRWLGVAAGALGALLTSVYVL